MVHKWRQALERSGQCEFLRLPAPGPKAPATVSTPTSTAAPRDANHLDTIRMEVPIPQGQLVVHWPVSQLPESIAWLQALTR